MSRPARRGPRTKGQMDTMTEDRQEHRHASGGRRGVETEGSTEEPTERPAGSCGGDAMSVERAQQLAEQANSGELKIPVGADELAEAAGMLARDRSELGSRLQRAHADFQNFQRRSRMNEDEARRQGMAGVVQSVVSVLDHFDLALTQNVETASAESILGGVRVIKDELIRVLTSHGVSVIEPEIGADFDPNRHEAIVQQPSDAHEPGAVVATMQPGYALGERIIRPAKVAVSVAPAASDGDQ